jgi:hypothetical protein
MPFALRVGQARVNPQRNAGRCDFIGAKLAITQFWSVW